jgi:hypothetical protein
MGANFSKQVSKALRRKLMSTPEQMLGEDPQLSAARTLACATPKGAVMFARNVDKWPHGETREAASQHPQWAYVYAEGIDEGPHDVTRAGVSRIAEKRAAVTGLGEPLDAWYACLYAMNIDKGPHPSTRKAANMCAESAGRYISEFGELEHKQTPDNGQGE